MEMLKNILVGLFQVLVLIALYPLFFIVGAYARTTRPDKFKSLSIIFGVCVFPAFGKWYLPMIYI